MYRAQQRIVRGDIDPAGGDRLRKGGWIHQRGVFLAFQRFEIAQGLQPLDL